jgi:ATP-dependent DNA helicase RecG
MTKPTYSYVEIKAWLDGGMNAELHWFPAHVRISRLAECLASMANSNGGKILLGISPRGNEIHGIANISEILDLVFQAALTLEPSLVIPVPRVAEYNERRIVVIVIPQGLPNVYSLDGRFWGREGSQNQPIPAKRLRELLLERGEIPFERRVPPGAELADIDIQRVREYINKLFLPVGTGMETLDDTQLVNQFLLQRGCLQVVNGQPMPTYAGLLMFSPSPQQWLPSSLILAVHFPGTRFAEEFAKLEIRGPLPDQLRQSEVFLRSNLRTIVRISGLSHHESYEYPFEAVRELLVNAVTHRDYNAQGDVIHIHLFSDRLEIHSPGGLPGPVNLQNLLVARFARNAIITQLLADLGFVERLGYGLDRVVSAMEERRLPAPKFEEVAGTFRVTLYNSFKEGQNLGSIRDQTPALELNLDPNLLLNSRQESVLGFLRVHPRITNKDYQELCPDVHTETLRRDLADLVAQGVLMKIGENRATYYILKENLIRNRK